MSCSEISKETTNGKVTFEAGSNLSLPPKENTRGPPSHVVVGTLIWCGAHKRVALRSFQAMYHSRYSYCCLSLTHLVPPPFQVRTHPLSFTTTASCRNPIIALPCHLFRLYHEDCPVEASWVLRSLHHLRRPPSTLVPC